MVPVAIHVAARTKYALDITAESNLFAVRGNVQLIIFWERERGGLFATILD